MLVSFKQMPNLIILSVKDGFNGSEKNVSDDIYNYIYSYFLQF